MQHAYRPQGVCAGEMRFTIDENGTVTQLTVFGGCEGNLKGLSRLVEGMSARDVIEKLEGLRCGGKPTSCPDQLAKALKQAL